MTGWTWQAGIGVLGGLAIFAMIFVPALIVQYRRYGRLSDARLLGLAAVSVYGVALGAYVFLPLPERSSVCQYGNIPFQKEPFHFAHQIIDLARQSGRRQALASWTTLQVILNVALFVPFGVIVRRYLGWGVLAATLLGFLVSAAIELTQWSGIWGLYPCNFRTGDVDDLITNTTGAFIGAAIAPALLFWMPQSRQLSRQRGRSQPVTVWRRWLGMLLDWVGFAVISWGVLGVAIATRSLAAGHLQPAPLWTKVVAVLLAGLAVFYLPAVVRRGASFGQTVVWLAPSWPDGGSTVRRLLRASVTGGVYTVGQLATTLGEDGGGPWSVTGLVCSLWVAICLVAVPLSGRARGLSARLTGAEMVDVRSPAVTSSSQRSG